MVRLDIGWLPETNCCTVPNAPAAPDRRAPRWPARSELELAFGRGDGREGTSSSASDPTKTVSCDESSRKNSSKSTLAVALWARNMSADGLETVCELLPALPVRPSAGHEIFLAGP